MLNFQLTPTNGPFVILIILDGVGLGKSYNGNSLALAKIPNLKQIWTNSKSCSLDASGSSVGLPDGVCGNSEVGHLNIGAGEIVYQIISKLNDEIYLGKFKQNKILIQKIQQCKAQNKKFHITGLLSASGIHSNIRHLFAILEICRDQQINPYLHLILDGRDTQEREAFKYLSALNQKIRELKIGIIASMSGRFWAMDRNNQWERTESAYKAMLGQSNLRFTESLIALQTAYNNGKNDENFEPVTIVNSAGNPITTIDTDDFIFFYNFREDRARQLTKAFVLPEFHYFQNRNIITKNFITMTGYEDNLPVTILYDSDNILHSVSDVISSYGMSQLHIAETEKYAHVTYFFNGGRELKHDKENFEIIPSPKVYNYAEVPEMSALTVKEEAINNIKKKIYNFVLINFANPDMIGHTGDLQACIKALEFVDKCVYEVIMAGLEIGAKIIITADHGNCEQEIDILTGLPDRKHTLNNVPFMFIDKNPFSLITGQTRDLVLTNEVIYPSGILSDISTTVLSLLNLPVANSMSGVNLQTVLN